MHLPMMAPLGLYRFGPATSAGTRPSTSSGSGRSDLGSRPSTGSGSGRLGSESGRLGSGSGRLGSESGRLGFVARLLHIRWLSLSKPERRS